MDVTLEARVDGASLLNQGRSIELALDMRVHALAEAGEQGEYERCWLGDLRRK